MDSLASVFDAADQAASANEAELVGLVVGTETASGVLTTVHELLFGDNYTHLNRGWRLGLLNYRAGSRREVIYCIRRSLARCALQVSFLVLRDFLRLTPSGATGSCCEDETGGVGEARVVCCDSAFTAHGHCLLLLDYRY